MAIGLMSVVVLVWVDIDDGKGGVSSGGKKWKKKYDWHKYIKYKR